MTIAIKNKEKAMKKSLLIIGATVMAIATQTANAAADPYIESDGTSGISTGYRVKGTSRLEVDFALTEQTEQARIFGDGTGAHIWRRRRI